MQTLRTHLSAWKGEFSEQICQIFLFTSTNIKCFPTPPPNIRWASSQSFVLKQNENTDDGYVVACWATCPYRGGSSLDIEEGRWKIPSMKNSCIYVQSIYIKLAHRKNRAGRQRKVTRPMITKVSFPYLIFFFFNFLWCRSNDQFCGQRSYAVRLSTNVSVIFTFWFCAGDFKNVHKMFCKIDFFNS